MVATTEQLSTARSLARFVRGTALFFNGYNIGVNGVVITLLTREYPGGGFGTHFYSRLVASTVFGWCLFGMLFLGWFFNGIQAGMPLAPFPIIASMLVYSYGIGSENFRLDVSELVKLLVTARMPLAFYVGGGHTTGSTFPYERWTKQDGITKNSHHRWFILGTKTMIDAGVTFAAFVPLVLYWIYGEQHIHNICGVSLGLGIVPAFVLFCVYMGYLDLLGDWDRSGPDPDHRSKLDDLRIPYSLTLRRYWKNVLGLSLAWFIYDFIMYPFGIYSSTVINNITGGSSSLSIVLAWSVVINLFYVPGTLLGIFLIDYLSLKTTLIVGLLLQAATGFYMSIMYNRLTDNVAAFAVIYGIFLCFGEVGPGSCLRLLAARTGAPTIDGQIYVIATAAGKVGAFIGTWAFPQIIEGLCWTPCKPRLLMCSICSFRSGWLGHHEG
ncbi:metabolite transporter [Pisolithus sp. B1]|nr:metabolite transporter [Pisolithus sp. B1]